MGITAVTWDSSHLPRFVLSGDPLDRRILYVVCGTFETRTEGIGVADWTLDEILLSQMDEQERVCRAMKYRSGIPLMC
jgi:hypothetical protein